MHGSLSSGPFTDPDLLILVGSAGAGAKHYGIVDSLGGGATLAYDGSGSASTVRVVSPPAEPGILVQQLLDDFEAVLRER